MLIRPDWGATLEPRFLHIGDPGGGDRMMLEGRLAEGAGEWAHVALVVESGQASNYMNLNPAVERDF